MPPPVWYAWRHDCGPQDLATRPDAALAGGRPLTWTVVLTGIGVVVAIVIAIVRAAWILMMKIGDLAADVKADHAKIGDLAADVKADHAKIGDLAADVKANHAKIGDLAADVKANHAKIGDLAADVKETRVMIGALTADVRADHAMIDALGKKIDKNHGEIRVDLANLRHGADIADLRHSLAAVIVGRPLTPYPAPPQQEHQDAPERS